MKKRYLDDYDGSQDIGSQASKYAMDVIFELAGDLQHIKDSCMAKVGGAIGIGKLIGDGLQYAMHSENIHHTHQYFVAAYIQLQ